MGRWIDRLKVHREIEDAASAGTDKTDKTHKNRGFVGFVRPPRPPVREFHGPPGWDRADWQARFDEIAGRLEFDEGLDSNEAETMAAEETRRLSGDEAVN